MAERLIDAEALIKKMKLEEAYSEYPQDLNFDDAIACIEDAPIIEAKPVVHAHWEKRNNAMTCSGCGFIYYSNGKAFGFCPECGAQMDEERSGKDGN